MTITRSQLGSLGVRLEASLQRAEMSFEQVRLLRAALARISAGTYGRCVRCGGEIGMIRLTSLPHASFCIRCQDDSFRHRDTDNMNSRRLVDEGSHNV
jgi:RNA polymerase-binding transcription factor DksA